MANYTYKCKTCNHLFEVEQSMMDDAYTSCSEIQNKENSNCNGEIYRVIGKNIGIQFLGSGFYINDQKTNETSSTSS